MDLVPSLLALAGAAAPDGVVFDGEDLLPTLLGKSETSREAPIYFSRPPDRKNFYGFENLPDLAVRQGRWKLLCDYDGGRPLLYDLEADPGETRNLAEQRPGLARELTEKTRGWWKEVGQAEGKNFLP
jgi:uncharacterized sulfatase